MRITMILLVLIILPFFLNVSYGSVVTESNLNFKIMMMKEKLMTPEMTIMEDNIETEVLELPETPKAPPSIPSNVQLNKLMIKERLMTPGINFMDDEGDTEIIELPETPLSPPFLPIDYHFTEDIRLEKNFVRNLMK